MRQRRSIFRGKGPKIRARKIGGQKLFSAVNVLLSYLFSLRLTIVSESTARVPNAIFANFSSVFQFKKR